MYLIFDLDDTLLDTSATAGKFKLMEVAQLWHRMGVLDEDPGRSEQQHRKMEAAGLDPARFDHVRIVEQGGKRAAFQDIAESWGLASGPGFGWVVVIGDRYLTDIAPAKELGMRTVMVGNQKAEQEPDARIVALEELAPILALWRRERHGNH